MNYQNIECPVCHRIFTDGDDIVVCPDCGTPHHRECWNTVHHCANINHHSTGFEWKNPNADAAPKKEEKASPHDEEKRRPFPPFGKVRCPECGYENTPGSERCAQCDSRLNRNTNAPFGAGGGVDPHVIPPNVLIDGIPAEEIAAYVKTGSRRYILNFINMERRESKLNFNLGAAIFGPIWCFYRKMYGVGFLYLLISTVVLLLTLPSGFSQWVANTFASSASLGSLENYSALMEQMLESMPVAAAWQSWLSYFFRIGTTLFFGILGDWLYKKKVKSAILSIRPQATNMPEYMSLLQTKGGVSILMSVVSIMLFTGLQNLVVFGLAQLFGI